MNSFILEKSPESDEIQRIVLSYTFMRVHEDHADEFARFAHILFDLETATYSYMIDTTGLPACIHRLLIGSSNAVLMFRMELEIE